MKLSVIVPAYNEEPRIAAFLSELEMFMRRRNGEIIVVNDGSTDGTLDVLKKFGKRIRVISYAANKGKGWAVKEGMRAAMGENIIFMDADGATSPDEIPKMLEALEHSDIAIGTRLKREGQPIQRTILSALFNCTVNLLFGLKVKDSLCGFKGFRKAVGKKLAREVASNRWEFDVELLARAKRDGYSISQVPIKWHFVGNSKMSAIKDPFKIMLGLLRLRLVLKI